MAARVDEIALAEYFALDDVMLLFLAQPDDEQPRAIEIPLSLEELRRFVGSHFGGGSPAGVRRLGVEDWSTMLEPLVEPIVEHVPPETILWLVPHDVLHYVPLHAVVVGDEYLIDRNPVCYTPSASVMGYCHAHRRDGRTRAVVLGDSAGDLRHAREEAHVVASAFGVRPHLGREATKALLMRELEERDGLRVLHVGCHGYFRSEAPLESGVVLAAEDGDGYDSLTAAEIFDLAIDADLVTLSACESGVAERRSGDELIGLTRALIYAGTPSAIVSLWTVDDLSTALVMERFYAGLRDGLTKVHALRRAQIGVRTMTSEEVVAHCDRRLAELDPVEAARASELRRDRADAQIAAGDLERGAAAYEQLLREARSKELPTAELTRTLALLQFKAEGGATTVDYARRPFEHVYHWAPFGVYGDWR